MDKNRMIIIAGIVIVAVLIIGLAVVMPNFGKEKVKHRAEKDMERYFSTPLTMEAVISCQFLLI